MHTTHYGTARSASFMLFCNLYLYIFVLYVKFYILLKHNKQEYPAHWKTHRYYRQRNQYAHLPNYKFHQPGSIHFATDQTLFRQNVPDGQIRSIGSGLKKAAPQ
jgi:hypothetical protein